MDERLKQLLRLVVEDVIETGEPVGSQRLVEVYKLDVSPATIRNWLVNLEEDGYLTQPHTSAGRVPTEKGYRFYLTELMEERRLRQREQRDLQRAALMLDAHASNVKRLAKSMSDMAQDAVVMSRQNADAFSTGIAHLLSQPEFAERDTLMGLGDVLDRMDEIMTGLRSQRFDEPTALIGQDCPFGEGCGSVFLTLDDGMLLGILGPLRMNYRQGFALLRSAKELMDDGSNNE